MRHDFPGLYTGTARGPSFPGTKIYGALNLGLSRLPHSVFGFKASCNYKARTNHKLGGCNRRYSYNILLHVVKDDYKNPKAGLTVEWDSA